METRRTYKPDVIKNTNGSKDDPKKKKDRHPNLQRVVRILASGPAFQLFHLAHSSGHKKRFLQGLLGVPFQNFCSEKTKANLKDSFFILATYRK